MKTFRVLIVVLALIATPVIASAISYSNSGTLVGVYSGNDTTSTLTSLGYDTSDYVKLDLPGTPSGTSYTNGTLTISSDDNWYSGLWSLIYSVNYYIVKASNQFAIYAVNPASSSGTWSTSDIDGGKHQLSHLTTIDAGETPPPVPEPATFILLGGGLVGLAFYRRRQKK